MRRHRRPRVICNGIAAAAIVVIKALRTTGIVTLNYQYRLIEEEIGKGEREGGERGRGRESDLTPERAGLTGKKPKMKSERPII